MEFWRGLGRNLVFDLFEASIRASLYFHLLHYTPNADFVRIAHFVKGKQV